MEYTDAKGAIMKSTFSTTRKANVSYAKIAWMVATFVMVTKKNAPNASAITTKKVTESAENVLIGIKSATIATVKAAMTVNLAILLLEMTFACHGFDFLTQNLV